MLLYSHYYLLKMGPESKIRRRFVKRLLELYMVVKSQTVPVQFITMIASHTEEFTHGSTRLFISMH